MGGRGKISQNTKEFTTLKNMRGYLTRSFSKWGATLNPELKQVVNQYQDYAYVAVNKVMRGQVKSDEKTEKTIDKLKQVFDQAPPLPNNLKVMRGIGWMPSFLPRDLDLAANFDKLKGVEFEDQGFVSTTLNPQMALRFGQGSGYALEMELPKNSKNAVPANIASGNKETLEEEMILKPGVFKITGYRIEPETDFRDEIKVLQVIYTPKGI
jgi:hypothetical protein